MKVTRKVQSTAIFVVKKRGFEIEGTEYRKILKLHKKHKKTPIVILAIGFGALHLWLSETHAWATKMAVRCT